MENKLLLLLAGIACLAACKRDELPPPQAVKVLTATEAFRHESISEGLSWFINEAPKLNYKVTHWPSADSLLALSYPQTKVLVLLQTTGNFMNTAQEEKLQQFVHDGGRIMAIHAATDAEYNWPWYGKLLGARFHSHPAIQAAEINPLQHHFNTKLPQPWTRIDEWYNFTLLEPGSAVLLNLDERSYTGGNMGNEHPIAWTRDFEGGRVFYTAMGHTAESYSEPYFQAHLRAGLQYLLQP